MEDAIVCGGAGASSVSDLALLATSPGRRRRGRLPGPCMRRAGHGPNTHPQALEASTAMPASAAIGLGRGARGIFLRRPKGGARGEPPAMQACRGGATTGRDTHRKKIGNWTDTTLENALNSITNDGMSFTEASRVYGIPTSSIGDHLYGRMTSRQKGIKPVLAPHEEKKL